MAECAVWAAVEYWDMEAREARGNGVLVREGM
jgi:hypothetical protein